MLNIRMPAEDTQLSPRLMVVGVGGAGGNAVANMINNNLQGVEFLVCNTDAQALKHSPAERKVQLGINTTRGLGAGARPDIGRVAAEETLDEIMGYLEGCNMAFITAGMGGGTGTGAAPAIARAARDAGILTVGVVTKPFHFEGAHRMRLADQGIEELQQYVDTLLVIPNQNLFRVTNEKTSFADAFKMADDVLHMGVRGVTDLIVMPGLINLDFADIRAVMSEMGKAMMGTGEAQGDRRAVLAAEAAIANPLLEDVSMQGARAMLINITGGMDMTLFEVDEACNRIRDEVDPEANIIFGASFNPDLDGTLRISIVATGIDSAAQTQRPPQTGMGTNTTTAGLTGMNVNAAMPTAAATPSATTTFARSIAQTPRGNVTGNPPRWNTGAAPTSAPQQQTTQTQNNAPTPSQSTVAQSGQGGGQMGGGTMTAKAQAQTAAFYGRNPQQTTGAHTPAAPRNTAPYGGMAHQGGQQSGSYMTAGNGALAYAEPQDQLYSHDMESAEDAGFQPSQNIAQHAVPVGTAPTGTVPIMTPVADIQPTTLGHVLGDDDHFLAAEQTIIADKNIAQSAPLNAQILPPQQRGNTSQPAPARHPGTGQTPGYSNAGPVAAQPAPPKRGGLFGFGGGNPKPQQPQHNVRSQHTAPPQPALIQDSQGGASHDEDLDIPAFLRRQAN